MSDPLTAYDRQAAELARLYETLPFEQVHEDALDLVPDRPAASSLDIGAGSGRDAA